VSRQQFSQQEKASKETMKKKVLFICVQNSARSQITAALLNEMCGDHFDAHSAGLEPGVLNPLAVEALRERGIDISGNKTQSVFDVWKSAPSRIILPTLEINRVHQAQRFFIRQNALFHLIHHIGERDFVFGIGESVTAAGAGMTE